MTPVFRCVAQLEASSAAQAEQADALQSARTAVATHEERLHEARRRHAAEVERLAAEHAQQRQAAEVGHSEALQHVRAERQRMAGGGPSEATCCKCHWARLAACLGA